MGNTYIFILLDLEIIMQKQTLEYQVHLTRSSSVKKTPDCTVNLYNFHTLVTTCTPITNRSIWSSFNIVLKLNKHYCQCLHGGEDSQLKFIATRLSCWICLLWSRGYSAQAKNWPPKFIGQSKESLKRNAGRVGRGPQHYELSFAFDLEPSLSFVTSKVFKMVVCKL